jgi:hypothetical protein
MTTQQPEHCKSEGRCIDFTFAPKEWLGENGQCLLCGCDGDTRSRPHTPAERCPFCDTHENNLMACYATEHKMTCSFVKQEGRCPINRAARAAMLATLDAITAGKTVLARKDGFEYYIVGKKTIDAIRQQEEK